MTSSEANIDIARELSKVNRKLVRQGRAYHISSIEVINQGVDYGQISFNTIPTNWVSKNAWVKAKSLWDQMNKLVLADNPSIKPKWHDFKVQMTTLHTSTPMNCLDGDYQPITYTDDAGNITGEWEYSEFVLPQHTVDPTTGYPLPAQKWEAFMLGPDLIVGDTGGSKNLITAYANSRATVFQNDPNVPAQMSLSFYNLLTDSGSQEPELADVLEDQNDKPPYNLTNYPGATVAGYAGFQYGSRAVVLKTTPENPRQISRGFVAPCGLLYVKNSITNPSTIIRIHLKEGSYCGVKAPSMEA
jgi:hypothetical protein